MTAVTIAALVVIPAGIAFFAWLWIRAGYDYREVRESSLEEMGDSLTRWSRDLADNESFHGFVDYLHDAGQKLTEVDADRQFWLERSQYGPARAPRLWETPDPADVDEYHRLGAERIRDAWEDEK